LSYADPVAVEIVDMQGRIMKSWPSEHKVAGAHVLVWEAGASKDRLLLNGNYICRIITSKGLFSKIISAY
jgi:flagellar hook assembly protein FlgD